VKKISLANKVEVQPHIFLLCVALMGLHFTGCTTRDVEEEQVMASADQGVTETIDESSAIGDELSLDDPESISESSDSVPAPNENSGDLAESEEATLDLSEELSLEESDAQAEKQTATQAVIEEGEAFPPPAEAPVPEPSFEKSGVKAQQPSGSRLTSLQFKSHQGGGTLVIEGDSPLVFKTRRNIDTNQFVVELENTKIDKKFKRPLITKDFEGPISGVDLYQSESGGARVVVQLRSAVAEPVVTTEGNTLLIVTGESEEKAMTASGTELESLASLADFISGNVKFYGKKISIETSEADIRDILRFIGEEAGINMIINPDVSGKLTVKLREIPWDQALIVILRARGLAYTRTGSVLRVGTLDAIQKEELMAIQLAAGRRSVEPLKVKLIPVSYAPADQLATQASNFKTDRGKIVGDNRTSSLIVTDTQEGIERIEKFVKSIDVPPTQVLIEGKVVEAQENLDRQLGIQWFMSGAGVSTGLKGQGGQDVRLDVPNINLDPGNVSSPTLFSSLTFGTLDVFGSLTAFLSMREREGSAKVISSPRIMTLHNEEASITQDRKLPKITSTVGEQAARTVNVSYESVKLDLKVKPQVTNDGAIIMNIEVSRDVPGPLDTATQARAIEARSAKTKVMVRNSQTAVIGGIYQNDQSESETRVPGLANIPILGWLFKSRSREESKNELLIFLTPRIVNQRDRMEKIELGEEAG
jgi:type IV pilus assembly protein PilQ